ncbi:MAG TPA: alanine--tRNA ligase [Candidatus Marinimicrobia bacterium]|nr:alanine--tRNA ligase [Candidatus Neomarinimicrobiota bacterium]
MKTAAEIRNDFLNYFESNGHKIVKSTPVIPQNDPTLLFINAGMNQFKSIFLNQENPTYLRIADSQKCIRVSGKHNDLEEVGKDTYHHTFFEMLGNWSFGDYYKKEAITYAWQLFTEVWKFPKERLWATVYKDDNEAEEIWHTETDIDPSHILQFGNKDNFWEMGETGPCGPCSEIHYYTGNDPEHQTAEKINADDPEYIELWNLVFIQYDRDKNGKLNPLPRKHVDTGAGLERIAAALQKKHSNYDTDLFKPIIDEIAQLTGVSYSAESGMPHRVIADHIRMLSFSIGDGGMPSNEGRGYVIRRILRRAARYGRMLNMHKPFIYKLVGTVCEILGDVYPEIIDRKTHIQRVIQSEERMFGETLDKGLDIYSKIKQQLTDTGKTQISGSDIFKLYDTYGFPVDLTQLMAEEDGLTTDMNGFHAEMKKQKERARSSRAFQMELNDADIKWTVLSEGKDSEFVGYEHTESEATIRKYFIRDGIIHLVLDKTPFYAESGGEVGDTGIIFNSDFQIIVTDTIQLNDSIVHIGKFKTGNIKQNLQVTARIDAEKGQNIRSNHTATHLLQAALRTILGNHVHQKGSLVTPDRLRFDLTHFAKIDPPDLEKIEDIVNQKIRENIDVHVALQDYAEAKESGAMALFGEKYDDVVRVITIGEFSKELCGGKHVRRTGDIGVFKIISESSVAAGIRRIEAVTGNKAFQLFRQNEAILNSLTEKLGVNKDKLIDRVDGLMLQVKNLGKELQTKSAKSIELEIEELLRKSPTLGEIALFAHQFDSTNMDELKKIGDIIRDKLEQGVALIASVSDGKPIIAVAITDATIKKYHLHAGHLIKEMGKLLGGGGGGKPHMATAGGKYPEKIPEVFEKFQQLINEIVSRDNEQ